MENLGEYREVEQAWDAVEAAWAAYEAARDITDETWRRFEAADAQFYANRMSAPDADHRAVSLSAYQAANAGRIAARDRYDSARRRYDSAVAAHMSAGRGSQFSV